MPRRKLTIFTILLLTFLAACGGPSSPGGGSSIVPLLQGSASPEDVAKGFLENWKTANYQAMYGDLSAPSQQEYTFPVFQKIYQDAMSKIAPDQITYTFHNVTLQGESAAIAYDVEFTSSVFGAIDDKDRTMRLVKTQDRWGVAWSSMDIVNGLVGGSQVVVKSRALPRGNIYDRNGQLLVDQAGSMVAMYSARQNMATESDCVDLLARVLKQRRYDLQKRFDTEDPVTVFYLGEIDKDTDTTNAAELDQKCAVIRRPRDTRTYIGEGAASQLTGYIAYATKDQLNSLKGYQEGDLVGQMGVEKLYQEQLAGKPEQVLQVISPSNVVLRELGGRKGTTPQSVTLTIDRDMQMTAGQAMADAYNYAEGNWGGPTHSPGAGLVAIDIKTGAILAMVSWPFFDPNIYNGTDSPNPDEISVNVQDPRAPLRNRTIQDQYFPGSTFKLVTTAAASSEKMMTEPTFDCTLEWKGQQYGDTLPVRTDWRALERSDSPFSKPAG
ncbi:MAG: penicillin-binding transpeptidase domain-containing protein, partial [Chloroflexota bacterium]